MRNGIYVTLIMSNSQRNLSVLHQSLNNLEQTRIEIVRERDLQKRINLQRQNQINYADTAVVDYLNNHVVQISGLIATIRDAISKH